MSKNIYTVDQFNTKNDYEEYLVQYVLNNVPDFGPRYSHALRIINYNRCSLSNADYELFRDISNAIYDYCADNGGNPCDYDIEKIFG